MLFFSSSVNASICSSTKSSSRRISPTILESSGRTLRLTISSVISGSSAESAVDIPVCPSSGSGSGAGSFFGVVNSATLASAISITLASYFSLASSNEVLFVSDSPATDARHSPATASTIQLSLSPLA